MHIKDRTFIITGGSSGLGRATCEDLYAQGGYIAILDMNAELGEQAIKDLGSNATFYECDVTDTDSVETAVKAAAEWAQKKGKPIGGIIASAGVGIPAKMLDRHLEPVSMSAIDTVLNINLRGTLDFVRQCLPYMAKNEPTKPDGERGVVILVSSSAAYDGQPGQVAYSASKGAIRSLTLPMARDLAQYGIRVMSIAPSLFESPMTAALPEKARKSLERVMEFPKRGGQPPEFASLVRQIIQNSMLNGETIRLDGAMRMPSKM
ncbi:NAD(P)-binding protein [Myriangium duriaei CBS 260.36]|uniref:NAD(P)-binding protein n=1 Tax=Myriangium duriaei CBS 260.36 TaxID=1168546 RepID=A0A9P4MF76_9PEZI|nr:NAD(P)-binding protein [Myriangium duriaei CBS 260.36]